MGDLRESIFNTVTPKHTEESSVSTQDDSGKRDVYAVISPSPTVTEKQDWLESRKFIIHNSLEVVCVDFS